MGDEHGRKPDGLRLLVERKGKSEPEVARVKIMVKRWQAWSIHERLWYTSAEIHRIWHQLWPYFDLFWTYFDQHRPNATWDRPNLARVRPTISICSNLADLNHICWKWARIRPISAQTC